MNTKSLTVLKALDAQLEVLSRGLSLDKQKKEEFLALVRSVYTEIPFLVPPVVSAKSFRRLNEDDKKAEFVKAIEYEARTLAGDPEVAEKIVALYELLYGPKRAEKVRQGLYGLVGAVEWFKSVDSEQFDNPLEVIAWRKSVESEQFDDFLDALKSGEEIIRDYPHFGEKLDPEISLLEVQIHVEGMVEDIKEILRRE